MPRKPRKRPRSSKIGLPDSDQCTSCSLAGRTTTSENGNRADRWKPSVLRSSWIAADRAGVDRQQVGERPAEQLLRLALEIVGELLRDVGQGAFRIGFPEPAAAAVLELGDEGQRLVRLGVQVEPAPSGGDDGAGAGDAVGDDDQRQQSHAARRSAASECSRNAPAVVTSEFDHRQGRRIDRDHRRHGDAAANEQDRHRRVPGVRPGR